MTPSQFETWVEVEVSQTNITRYLASKEQLSIFQNHVNGTLFGCWVTRLLFYLNHFMLITCDNEVWFCRYYHLTLDNIFKLSFITVVAINFIPVASILHRPSIARVLCYTLNFSQQEPTVEANLTAINESHRE